MKEIQIEWFFSEENIFEKFKSFFDEIQLSNYRIKKIILHTENYCSNELIDKIGNLFLDKADLFMNQNIKITLYTQIPFLDYIYKKEFYKDGFISIKIKIDIDNIDILNDFNFDIFNNLKNKIEIYYDISLIQNLNQFMYNLNDNIFLSPNIIFKQKEHYLSLLDLQKIQYFLQSYEDGDENIIKIDIKAFKIFPNILNLKVKDNQIEYSYNNQIYINDFQNFLIPYYFSIQEQNDKNEYFPDGFNQFYNNLNGFEKSSISYLYNKFQEE